MDQPNNLDLFYQGDEIPPAITVTLKTCSKKLNVVDSSYLLYTQYSIVDFKILKAAGPKNGTQYSYVFFPYTIFYESLKSLALGEFGNRESC